MDRANDRGSSAATPNLEDAPLILAPEHQISSRLSAFLRVLDAEFESVRRLSEA